MRGANSTLNGDSSSRLTFKNIIKMYKTKKKLFIIGFALLVLSIGSLFVCLITAYTLFLLAAIPFLGIALISLLENKEDASLSISIIRASEVAAVAKILKSTLHAENPLFGYLVVSKDAYKRRIIILTASPFEVEHLAEMLKNHCSINIYYPDSPQTYLPCEDYSMHFKPKLKLKYIF